ncbi:uncharacterized protein LOC142574853 [Dermacentor variabilis]|uniref:uncharacterized protein LOC142574853 n=1 Tax=Dermacentor variabilis TaxID=34621 RepID=UPI003F5B658A
MATVSVTHYAEMKVLPKGSAAEEPKFCVENALLRHSAPGVMITERATAFTGSLTQAILQYIQTGNRTTTAYYPPTNCLTERLNNTLSDVLSMYTDVELNMWDAVLPFVTFPYNTAAQETTHITPFKQVYRRNPTTTLDAMPSHVTAEKNLAATAYLQCAKEARQVGRLRIKNLQRPTADTTISQSYVEHHPGDWGVPSRRPCLGSDVDRPTRT